MGDEKIYSVWELPSYVARDMEKDTGIATRSFELARSSNPNRRVVGELLYYPPHVSAREGEKQYFGGLFRGAGPKARAEAYTNFKEEGLSSTAFRPARVLLRKVEVKETLGGGNLRMKKEDIRLLKEGIKERFPGAKVARRKRKVAVRNVRTGETRTINRQNVFSLRDHPSLRSVSRLGNLSSRALGVVGAVGSLGTVIGAAKAAKAQKGSGVEKATTFMGKIFGIEPDIKDVLKNRT